MLFNVIVVPIVLIVGSNVMVKDPITGSTGTEKPGLTERKPLAVKLIVSVIVPALAVFVASAPNASAQIAANKGKDFLVAPLSTDRRSDDAQEPPVDVTATQLDLCDLSHRSGFRYPGG